MKMSTPSLPEHSSALRFLMWGGLEKDTNSDLLKYYSAIHGAVRNLKATYPLPTYMVSITYKVRLGIYIMIH